MNKMGWVLAPKRERQMLPLGYSKSIIKQAPLMHSWFSFVPCHALEYVSSIAFKSSTPMLLSLITSQLLKNKLHPLNVQYDCHMDSFRITMTSLQPKQKQLKFQEQLPLYRKHPRIGRQVPMGLLSSNPWLILGKYNTATTIKSYPTYKLVKQSKQHRPVV